MNNNDAIIAFYELVNRLYSINYSAHRISKQMKPMQKTDKFNFKMPYEPKGVWTDAKLRDVSRLRNEFFTFYSDINSKNQEQYRLINEDLERSKETLMQMHNIWYEKNMTFDEIFDGFICKSPDLIELAKLIETQVLITNNPCIMHIANAYTDYISNLFYKTITQSMIDIIEQLENDVNSNSVPSLYDGIILNDNLTTISAEKIKKLRSQIEASNKHLHSVKVRKNNPELLSRYNIAMNKYYQADVFLLQLESRVKSANTDINNALSNRIVESTMDFLTGTPPAEKLIFSEVYAGKLELNYITYLTQMLNYAMQNFDEYVSVNAKQKN